MITIILIAIAYVFVGSIIGGRHHALASKTCDYRYGKLVETYRSTSQVMTCFDPRWCAHIHSSVWFYGVAWPLALPITAGYLIGSSSKDNRVERRRARELAEAEHKVKLAELARREDEELTRQLESTTKSAPR